MERLKKKKKRKFEKHVGTREIKNPLRSIIIEINYSDYAFLVLRLCVNFFGIQTTLQRSQYQIEYQKKWEYNFLLRCIFY
jgi:hypothetical protein